MNYIRVILFAFGGRVVLRGRREIVDLGRSCICYLAFGYLGK